MHIYITIFPKSNPAHKIKLSDIQKDYRSICIELKSLNHGHKLNFLKYLENDNVYVLGNINKILLESPTEIHHVKYLKDQFQNIKENELRELEDYQKYTVVKKYKYQHRIEFEEFYSTIYLEKYFGYDNLVQLEEMVDNHLIKRVSEIRETEIIETLTQTGYCYKLSTDIDKKYEFLNPIYIIAYTIAKYVDGTIQIDAHHHDNWECGIYENEEFKQELENKIRTIITQHDQGIIPSS